MQIALLDLCSLYCRVQTAAHRSANIVDRKSSIETVNLDSIPSRTKPNCWPGDSEGTLRSSSEAAIFPLTHLSTTIGEGYTLSRFIAERQAEKL